MTRRKTAGEIQNQLNKDTTKYNALEIGHSMTDHLYKHLDECIETHLNFMDEGGEYPYRKLDEFCVVMILAEDNLLSNVKRRKFYCSPFLPKPRPNQTVFWFKKSANQLVKRLWTLPRDIVMAELASINYVDRPYKQMQAWSIAFFEGRFLDYIRYESGTTMVSQEEYISEHREELIEAGFEIAKGGVRNPFDFSKIHIKNVVDTQEAVV